MKNLVLIGQGGIFVVIMGTVFPSPSWEFFALALVNTALVVLYDNLED